ncbi:MAG: response regulator [Acidobacteria bacterium]|nr:response regulator [Acidobacteriota bacterium]
MSIRTKLFVAVLALAVPALLLVGTLSYLGSKATLERSTFDRLTAVRADKARQVGDYFGRIRAQAGVLSESRTAVEAIRALDAAYKKLGKRPLDEAQRQAVTRYYEQVFVPGLRSHTETAADPGTYCPADAAELYLQYWYVVANPNPEGEKSLLDDPGDGSGYSAVHRRYNKILRDFVKELGFHDIFLINDGGRVVYTVSKEVDLGTDLLHGPFADSNLAAAYRKIRDAGADARPLLVDYARYAPSLGEPASFMVAPIVDGDRRLGVLAFQIPIDEIDRITTSNRKWRMEGMGETGETYLIGHDFTMRSNSRFVLEDPERYERAAAKAGASPAEIRQIRDFGTTILIQEVRTPPVLAAMAGRSGTMITRDYRGIEVLSSYAPLRVEDVDWVILSEIDTAEAFAPIGKLARKLAAELAGLLLLVLAASWLLSRRFVAPIVELDGAARRFAEGAEDVEVRVASRDELGSLAGTFNEMVRAIRRNAAELKRKAEELESVPTAILRWDPEGRIVFMNDFGLELFGFTAEDLIGKKIPGTIVPPSEAVERNLRTMAARIASDPKKYESDETENRRKDGERIWMAWRNTPILDDDGTLREILTIGIDITERRRIEREIAEQKQLLENTLESLTHPFYVIDAADYSIKVANSAARALGPPEAVTCYALTHDRRTPCGGEEHRCPLLEVRKTRRPFTVEHIHPDSDGEPRYVEVHGYPVFDDDGEVIQMIEYSLDITERKAMELQLERARDAAEAANRAKSTFLANMSHELRTPMNAIIGYSEMLAEDAEDNGLDEMIPDLEKINAAGRHLLALINDILDLSKIEAGRMDLYFETFDLGQMLGEAVATITPLVTKNGNRLVTDYDENLGKVRLDLTKLRQALFNLLSNAAKFTSNGTITLAARREQRGGEAWITLSVRDTGIGIRQEKLEKVFEEFAQADDSTTRDFGGTGLGLAISRRFCRMMGGDITVRSEYGKGATFTIELPAKVDAMQAVKFAVEAGQREVPGPQTVARKPVSARPILVVDDDPHSRDLLQKTLEAEGFPVVTASNGEEGLRLARELRPVLMTLDVLMPGMDGWAVLQEVKADPELADTPVMMISIAGDRGLGFTLGAVECLTKPVDRERLRRLARQYARPSGGGHALVVDDDEGVRSLFGRALEADGWTVNLAENGAVALKMAAARRPDLVLLDLMMPVMDGLEFVMRYRRLEDCKETPVIVVTAKDLDEEERRELLGGVERIVEKGALTRDELLEQVRELVKRRNTGGDGQTSGDAGQ